MKAMSAANWRSRLTNLLRDKRKFGDEDTGDKCVEIELY